MEDVPSMRMWMSEWRLLHCMTQKTIERLHFSDAFGLRLKAGRSYIMRQIVNAQNSALQTSRRTPGQIKVSNLAHRGVDVFKEGHNKTWHVSY